jgi:redox-sensitive bicupin YhaK (pirin superfamily)
MAAKKSILRRNIPKHWVGNGFHVQTMFSPNHDGNITSPFLLLDYAEAEEFTATKERRGIGEHPHRGFETVTIVYQGAVDHRDSRGNRGSLKSGDVQWMTAGKGILHEEWHGEDFAKMGGVFELVQLWVDLPRSDKMTEPRYQDIPAAKIPIVSISKDVSMRIIAGNYLGHVGPAQTFSPMNVFDIRLGANSLAQLDMADQDTFLVMNVSGTAMIDETQSLNTGELLIFEQRSFKKVSMHALTECKLLLLTGENLNQPIFSKGPFVMTSAEDLHAAFVDYQAGHFAR